MSCQISDTRVPSPRSVANPTFMNEFDNNAKGSVVKKRLTFKESVDVALIPSRTEFKAASCDLWWSRDQFNANQNATLWYEQFSSLLNENLFNYGLRIVKFGNLQ